jgi:hypothetical protein
MIVGPGADSTLIVGGAEHDTHITITTNSLSLAVLPPVVQDEFTLISALVGDAFASTTYTTSIIITGMVDAETITGPSIAPGGNGTLIVWVWNHVADGAKNGDYTITVTVSYSEDNLFMSTATYTLEFQQPKEDGGLFGGGLESLLLIIIPIIVVVIVVIVVVKIVLSRREERASEAADK